MLGILNGYGQCLEEGTDFDFQVPADCDPYTTNIFSGTRCLSGGTYTINLNELRADAVIHITAPGNYTFQGNGNQAAKIYIHEGVSVTIQSITNLQFYNKGIVEVTGNFAMNTDARFVNFGELTIGGNLAVNGWLTNYGSVYAGGDIQVNKGARVCLQRGSVIEGEDTGFFNDAIYGNGGCFRIRQVADENNYLIDNGAVYEDVQDPNAQNGHCDFVKTYGTLVANSGSSGGTAGDCNFFSICTAMNFSANEATYWCLGKEWPLDKNNFYGKMGLNLTDYPVDKPWQIIINGMILRNKCENCTEEDYDPFDIAKINYGDSIIFCNTETEIKTPTVDSILGSIGVSGFEVTPETGLNTTGTNFPSTGAFIPFGSEPGEYVIRYYQGDCFWADTTITIIDCACLELGAGDIDSDTISICSGTEDEIIIGGRSATGGNGANYEYEWYRNGELIPGSNDSTYTIRPIDKINAGNDTIKYVFTRRAKNGTGGFIECPGDFEDSEGEYTLIVMPYSDASQIKVLFNQTKYCNGDSATLTAQPIPGMTNPVFVWYEKEDSETSIFEGNPFKVKLTNDTRLPQDTIFWVSVYEDGFFCEDSVRMPVPVSINPYFDVKAIEAVGDTICHGETATLTASVTGQTGLTFVWYEVEEDGVALPATGDGSIFTTEELSANEDGTPQTYTYYVSAYSDNFCEDTLRQAVTVVVNPYSDNDALIKVKQESDTVICAGFTATLEVTAPGVINPVFRWYATADDENEEPIWQDSIFVTKPLFNDTIFYVTVEGDNYCEGKVRRAIPVKVNPLPNITLNTDLNRTATCDGSMITITTDEGMTNYTWSTYDADTRKNDGSVCPDTCGGSSEDNFITITWENDSIVDATKIIKLNYIDENGCTAVEPDSIEIKVYGKVPVPQYTVSDCNDTISGVRDIIIGEPLLTDGYFFALQRHLHADDTDYDPFQDTTNIYRFIENGLHTVKAGIQKDASNFCESDEAIIEYMDCGCDSIPEVRWYDYENILVDTTTCGTDPVERDLGRNKYAVRMKVETNGAGELSYIGKNGAEVVIDSDGYIINDTVTVVYTPKDEDAFQTIRVIATSDTLGGDGNANCRPNEAIWEITVIPRPIIDPEEIDVKGDTLLCFEAGEDTIDAVFSATYTGDGLTSEPIFAWYTSRHNSYRGNGCGRCNKNTITD